MQKKANILSECLEFWVKNDAEKPINIFEFTMPCALDVICETILGVQSDCQRNPENIYYQNSKRYVELKIHVLFINTALFINIL